MLFIYLRLSDVHEKKEKTNSLIDVREERQVEVLIAEQLNNNSISVLQFYKKYRQAKRSFQRQGCK